MAQAPAAKSVTLCQALEPPVLDPTAGAAAAIREVTNLNIFEGLMAFDSAGKIYPRLAQKVDVSEDGLVYHVALRKGVTFHDGETLDSSHVKFSFERAKAADSKNAQKWIFEPIDVIETPAPDQVVIKLKHFQADFLEGLAWADAAIFSSKSVEKAATAPIGTGPYRFTDWKRGDRLKLTKNETWWGNQKGLIAEANFRFITDPQAQAAALLAGDCDANTNFGAQEMVKQFQADARFMVTIGRTEGETILAMNNAKPPFNDKRVREAFALAIDKNLVNLAAVQGYGTLIGSHFSPNHPAYIDLSKKVTYDLDRAKKLLQEAGYGAGLTVSLRLPPPNYARRGGEVIAAMLAKIGVTATIEPVEWPQWLERVFKNKDFDLTMIAHVEPNDINIYARDSYYFGYSSAPFKALIEKTRTSRSAEERKQAFVDAQKLLAEDQVNVFLFMLPKITITKQDLKGMWANWPIPANPIEELRWP